MRGCKTGVAWFRFRFKFMPHLENKKQQIIITGLFVLTQTILLSLHAVTKISSCWVQYAIICNEITAVLSDSPA